MTLSRSILIALAAAGLGLAVAARPARGEASDAAVVIGWVRWAHELSKIGHDAARVLTRLLTSARETADAVSTLLASADSGAAPEASVCPEPDPFVGVRLADLPARADTMDFAPLPPNATLWRVSARCAAVQQDAWREASTLRAEILLNQEMLSHDAARLSREARRLVRVQM
ncbi:MAG: hypothetical protein K2Y21_01750 [Phycisphaerales bacterium]|nr:hypothetical protein [Phycisphaerales bacterium]